MRAFFRLLVLTLLTFPAAADVCGEECQAAHSEVDRLKPGVAERRGETLTLHPRSGAALVFQGHGAACRDEDVKTCDAYLLRADNAASHAWVLQKSYYEGGDSFLIDQRDGHQTSLTGMPVFSPDGQTFLITPNDLMGGTSDNVLEIWRRKGDGANIIWSLSNKEAQASYPQLQFVARVGISRWSASGIDIVLYGMDGKSQWPARLDRTTDGWRFAMR